MSTEPRWFDRTSVFFEDTVEQKKVTEICSVLSNKRRQFVILYLLGQKEDQWIRTATISRWIAAIEQEVSVEQATGSPYHRVRTSLLQNHLDTLSERRIISYESDRNRLKRGSLFESTAQILLILYLISPHFQQ